LGLDFRLQHRIGTRGGPRRALARPAVWPWRTTNCTPGASWSSHGSSCVLTCVRRSSLCRNSWKKDSARKSRYVLSVVSLITFIVSKIARGHIRGGVVFGTLLPELRLNMGGMEIDSFWIGSVLVNLPSPGYTRFLAACGRWRTTMPSRSSFLIVGSASLTFYGLHQLGGWSELRHWCGSDMFNLWKPLIPAGVQGTWSPVDRKQMPRGML